MCLDTVVNGKNKSNYNLALVKQIEYFEYSDTFIDIMILDSLGMFFNKYLISRTQDILQPQNISIQEQYIWI